jgi:hypothetical protein
MGQRSDAAPGKETRNLGRLPDPQGAAEEASPSFKPGQRGAAHRGVASPPARQAGLHRFLPFHVDAQDLDSNAWRLGVRLSYLSAIPPPKSTKFAQNCQNQDIFPVVFRPFRLFLFNADFNIPPAPEVDSAAGCLPGHLKERAASLSPPEAGRHILPTPEQGGSSAAAVRGTPGAPGAALRPPTWTARARAPVPLGSPPQNESRLPQSRSGSGRCQ